MYKKISEMTASDKAKFLEQVKQSLVKEYGVSWEFIEEKMRKEIDDTFDDEKFVKMDPESLIDAAYARKEFGNHKPELVDYILWMSKFVAKSEYVEF